MEFDVNKMDQICRDEKNNDIFKSKYLKEDVPYVNYCDGDLYCIPVDGKRIYDPLFNTGNYIIGTIVGSQLRSKPNGVFQSEDDGSKVEDDETFLFEKTGKTVIVPAKLNVPQEVYSDGESAYYVWWYHLVRVDYMILTNPYCAADYHYGDIHRFLNAAGNEKIWEEQLKSKLSDKPLLPMLVVNSRKKLYKSIHELDKLQRKHEYEYKVYDELRCLLTRMKNPRIRPEEIEDIRAAMVDPYKNTNMAIIKLPEHLKKD